MIGYLLVLLFVALNMGESIIVKEYSKRHSSGGFVMNAIIALFACVFFAVTDKGGFCCPLEMIPYALVNAVFYSCGFYFTFVAFKDGPFGLSRLISNFSLIFPIFYGIFFLKEPAGVFTYGGIVMIGAAMFMMNYRKKGSGSAEQKGDVTLKWFVFIMISTVANGLISVVTRMQQLRFNDACSNEFQMLSVGGSFIFLATVGLMHDCKNLGYILKNGTLYGTVAGLLNGAKNLAILFIYQHLPISTVSPLKAGLGIIASFLLSVIAYKEKYSLLQKIGVTVGAVAVVLLTFA
ncbi:MAG: DMT family transporter [Clostridia bacterium]|nr:DMT family transporter [Clostridia bacterium]